MAGKVIRALRARLFYNEDMDRGRICTSFLIFAMMTCGLEARAGRGSAGRNLSGRPKQVLSESQLDNLELKSSFYYRAARAGLSEFQQQSFTDGGHELDVIFYKMEKRVVYQEITPTEIHHFDFNHLTNSVVRYIQILKSNYDLAIDPRKRALMQLNFYGLSQAIKKANELNLTIQSDQFDKLHDMLLSHATNLFYASYKEVKYTDYFWTSYFLHELGYPMDLTAKHLDSLSHKIKTFRYPEKYRGYGEKLARLSLGFAQKVSKPSREDLDVLYGWALSSTHDANERQAVQRNYLKQLQLIGDTETVKLVKKEIATNLLIQEGRAFLKNPLGLLKFLQFVIGYVFVAWPLEVILFVVSIAIFSFQASSVLTREESKRAKGFHRKMWIMFTKAYLGGNVPFFSKVAASLILFGIGLYFNSARNFVESLISSF